MIKRQRRITILAECIDDLLEGETVSACLERYQAHREEIEPLLTVVAVARQADAVPPRLPEAAAKAKADFLAAAGITFSLVLVVLLLVGLLLRERRQRRILVRFVRWLKAKGEQA